MMPPARCRLEWGRKRRSGGGRRIAKADARWRSQRCEAKTSEQKPMIRLVTERQSDSQSSIRTIGLASVGHSELRAEIRDPELMGEAEEFLNYVTHYVTTSGKRIGPGETMAYGYWLPEVGGAEQKNLENWGEKTHASAFG